MEDLVRANRLIRARRVVRAFHIGNVVHAVVGWIAPGVQKNPVLERPAGRLTVWVPDALRVEQFQIESQLFLRIGAEKEERVSVDDQHLHRVPERRRELDIVREPFPLIVHEVH